MSEQHKRKDRKIKAFIETVCFECKPQKECNPEKDYAKCPKFGEFLKRFKHKRTNPFDIPLEKSGLARAMLMKWAKPRFPDGFDYMAEIDSAITYSENKQHFQSHPLYTPTKSEFEREAYELTKSEAERVEAERLEIVRFRAEAFRNSLTPFLVLRVHKRGYDIFRRVKKAFAESLIEVREPNYLIVEQRNLPQLLTQLDEFRSNGDRIDFIGYARNYKPPRRIAVNQQTKLGA